MHASGHLIAFLDADIRLAPRALEALVKVRHKAGGVISVVPFHYTEKFVERLALIFNVLGVFAFTSPFEKKNPKKGLYGSCILTTREDYEKIKGHQSIESELLDDLNLGATYRHAGIQVTNFIGRGLVSFVCIDKGSEARFKASVKEQSWSTSTLSPGTILLVAIWVVGLIASETFFLFINTSWALPLFIGYLLYMIQLFYLIKHVGACLELSCLSCMSSQRYSLSSSCCIPFIRSYSLGMCHGKDGRSR